MVRVGDGGRRPSLRDLDRSTARTDRPHGFVPRKRNRETEPLRGPLARPSRLLMVKQDCDGDPRNAQLPVRRVRWHPPCARRVARHRSPATLCRDREEPERKGVRWTMRFGLGRTSTRHFGPSGGGSRGGDDRGIGVRSGTVSAQPMRRWTLAPTTADFWLLARTGTDFASSTPSLVSFA